MPPNRNLQIRGAFMPGSPPPLTCPYCPRRFRSKSGRTQHMLAKHNAEVHDPNGSSSSLSPSPLPSPLQQSPSHEFHHEPPSSPIEHPIFDRDETPPGSDFHIGHELSRDSSPGDCARERRVPAPPRVTRVYHPKLNGKSNFSVRYVYILTLVVGQICDENGYDIPSDTPPPARDSDQGPGNWAPYNNRLGFEVADFLYRRNQTSAGDINFILGLWAASLVIHGDEPPFLSAKHMYDTIDSTPLGDVHWESITLQYEGAQPVDNTPSWMKAGYTVWFQNSRALVHNIISNPDFEPGFDYAPFQERTAGGVHRFCDFMSANWAWSEAVSSFYRFLIKLTPVAIRPKLPTILEQSSGKLQAL
jgi:hypothetical protein